MDNNLEKFIDVCSQFVDINKDKFVDIALQSIKYYRGDKSARSGMRKLQELEEYWYKTIDYSVYDNPYYLADIWAGWIIYSSKYLKSIQSSKSLYDKSIVYDIGDIHSIIDLGCGVGYTTGGLKELFPRARVYGTNLKDSCQYKIAKSISKNHMFNTIPDIHSISKVDLVFASEYFEHILRPVEHLLDIINTLKPGYFLIANSFNTVSIGHFKTYKHKEISIPSNKISRLFNTALRNFGYEKVQTKLWNQRPSYWKLVKK